MLAAEVLGGIRRCAGCFEREELRLGGRSEGGRMRTHSTDDILVVREMSLAVLAAIDLMAVQIHIVRETHLLLSLSLSSSLLVLCLFLAQAFLSSCRLSSRSPLVDFVDVNVDVSSQIRNENSRDAGGADGLGSGRLFLSERASEKEGWRGKVMYVDTNE